MTFEFDPEKSAANKVKHELDFVEAQALWMGETLEIPAASVAESRTLVIARSAGNTGPRLQPTAEAESALSLYVAAATKKSKPMKTVKTDKKAGEVTSLDGRRTISTEEFDRLFEEGSDEIDQFIDWNKAKVVSSRMAQATKVNVDFPAWVVSALDREAGRIGVARQALIKLWIVERLEAVRG